jgi:3-oxoacyl-[acyl-carrier-protein] synthase II
MASYIDYLATLSQKQLMVMLARQRHEETQPIAIVGMSCRFPAGIDDPRGFWTLLRQGGVVATRSERGPVDSKGRARWNLDAPDLAPLAPLLRTGSYLRDVDLFDADYFGISEEEALHMDPQQRLLLEATVQALADANLPRASLRGQRAGIFVGTSPVEYPYAWLRNGLPEGALSPFMGTGSTPSAASGRLGLMLGVNGPAMNVDCASSSVLVALHLAATSLRRRECDLAIIGACNLLLSPFATAILARTGMISKSGRSRPFGEQADGHVRGEGCGIFVLKRQQDALADGDLPYAVVRGSAMYQNGDRLGLAVSSSSGQKAVIELALRAAGVDPLEVQYVEAQANGSRLGGVVEAEAMAQAYGRPAAAGTPLYVGSCKANLGYLETASGAPSLMKAVLALAHAEIPPQPGVDQLDRSVDWNGLALRFATSPTRWPAAERRLAGVSAFGFTGTNAHVVLESVAERAAAAAEPAASDAPMLLVLSAHHEAALQATARRLHDELAAREDWSCAAVCRTLAVGRDLLKVRRVELIRDRASLLAALAAFAASAASPAPPAPRLGVHLSLPSLDDDAAALPVPVSAAFDGLRAKIAARAAAMQPPAPAGAAQVPPAGAALATALGWLDWLAAAAIEVTGATLVGRRAGALVDVVIGRTPADRICEQWREGALAPLPLPATPRAGWELTATAEACALRRPGRSASPLALATIDLAGWLDVCAEQLRAGADLNLAVIAGPRRGLCRLPGPVLPGKSYWPAHNLWS